MSYPPSCRVHPSAVLSPDVELGENVEVGPFAVLEGNIKVGPDCVIRPGAYLFGNVTLGRGNVVYTGAILGEKPQHLKYHDEPTSLEIGDGNTFREGVTVHRGTTHSMKTVIGNHNYFMVNSHVAHDCVIGNRCYLTNGALVAGHCVIEDNVILSGNSAVHQFCRVGRLAFLSGCSTSTKDIPPFVIQQGINTVSGVNLVGMKRAGLTHAQIQAVSRAFRVIFRAGLPLSAAMAKLERDLGGVDVVQELLTFLRGCPKGINPMRSRFRDEAA